MSTVARFFYFSIFSLVLTGCVQYPEFSVSEVNLLSEQTDFNYQSSHVKVVGYLSATINTPNDIIDYAVENDLNLWYEISGCDSGVSLSRWPYFYKVDNNANNYNILFNYKSSPSDKDKYNLAEEPENLCLVVGMGDVGSIGFGKPEPFVIPITQELVENLKNYDNQGGAIDINLSDKCIDRMCVPKYTK